MIEDLQKAFNKQFLQFQEQSRDLIEKDWPELNNVIESIFAKEFSPRSILCLASCGACGGNLNNTVPVTIAMELVNKSVRLTDDIQDKDKFNPIISTLGFERSIGISMGLIIKGLEVVQNTKHLPNYDKILSELLQNGMLLLKGQDIDLKNQSMDLDGYWNLIVLKTGRSFSLITECGALTANTSSQNVKLLHDFGLHLGCIVQVLNDYRGFWLNQDSEDLLNTRYTLPIVYGITKESHVRSQLIEITSGPDWSTSKDQIHALLNEIDAKRFILTIALKERKKAIQVLSQLEGANQAFITILQSYLDVMFINIDELVEE